ncbi:MAG: glycosyltransferase family 4 protein [Spirochaetaceae bacterium]|nr:glycosyltransferase family 4 protein [Spirochaetaceae bacterium]
MKILITANTSWYIFNFRSNLITALINQGHIVETLAPVDSYTERLVKVGVAQHHFLKMDKSGTNPIKELFVLFRFFRILLKSKPDIIFSYTPKVNIYVSLIARFLQIPVAVNVSGLGIGFSSNGFLKKITVLLYHLSIKKAFKVFFQNSDDQAFFIEQGLVKAKNSELIPGSGVDLIKFNCDRASTCKKEKTVFLLVARLIWGKGIKEYVEAARIIKSKYPHTEFQIAGFIDYENPSAVPESELNQWIAEGIIKYLGSTDDIKSFYLDADCAVLPSFYREGIPRTLLEAAAMSLPVITTDNVGCRNTVDHGKTGFLCMVKDAADLAKKMESFLNMSYEQQVEMGKAGRKKMQQEFDEKIVISKYLALLEQ